MNILSNKYTTSICDDGASNTYLSQAQFTLSGCDKIRFAFDAVPGAGPNVCGRCFALEFIGYGKYESRKNHKGL